MSNKKEIYFDFDKFNNDLEKRTNENIIEKNVNDEIKEQDELRRKRAELYHEKWQNSIRWGKK